jgi:predicted O-methyltransferase YrrM
VRLLRPGGVIAFDNALRSGTVADSAYRDPSCTALRGIGAMVRDDETLIPLMLPLGDGLLLALRT